MNYSWSAGRTGWEMPECKMSERHWQAKFLAALRTSGNVSHAARHAARSRSAVYGARRGDTAFAADWEDALEEAADRLELEALRRAVEGTVEDRFYQGTVIGSITRYSDNLLMFLLKVRRPWQFDPQFWGRMPAIGDDEDRTRAEIERKMARLADSIAARAEDGIPSDADTG